MRRSHFCVCTPPNGRAAHRVRRSPTTNGRAHWHSGCVSLRATARSVSCAATPSAVPRLLLVGGSERRIGPYIGSRDDATKSLQGEGFRGARPEGNQQGPACTSAAPPVVLRDTARSCRRLR